MPWNSKGSKPLDLSGWRKVFARSISVPSSVQNIAANSVGDAASTGIAIKIPVGGAIWIRRYIVGVVSATGIFVTISPGVVNVTLAGTFANTVAMAGGGNLLPFASAGQQPGSGSWNTVVGDQVQLTDDWWEWDDYRDVPGVALPLTLTLQGRFRVLNASGVAANVTIGPETVLYELWNNSRFLRE